MKKHIVFFQGAGDAGYEADQGLVNSLQAALGDGYEIYYPQIKSDETTADFGWMQQIGQYISETKNDVILVAHSLGATMLLRYLSENTVDKKIAGIFLLATPFWNGNEDWKKGLMLQENFAATLPAVPVFFYQCKDDEEVPLSHLDTYRKKITRGIFREIESGGHQFNTGLTVVAKDIQSL